MTKLIKDIWVLATSGVTLYSRVLDTEKINPQLFGALMSALNTFAEKLSNGGISNLEMSNMKFVIVRRRDYLFVGTAANKVKEKKIVEELKIISDKFFEVYSSEILLNWDGDITYFSNFGEYIEPSLEKGVVDKLKDAFWT